MKKANAIAITQTAEHHSYKLVKVFAWATLFSITASISLFAAAIYIQ
jgi:hypothetical protein